MGGERLTRWSALSLWESYNCSLVCGEWQYRVQVAILKSLIEKEKHIL